MLNPDLEPSPHWVVVKGYDKDTFYINDPYSDSTIAMEPQVFKDALSGYENEYHMISVKAQEVIPLMLLLTLSALSLAIYSTHDRASG